MISISTAAVLTQQGQLSFGEITSSGFTVYWSPFLGRTSYELSISNQAGRIVPASGDAVQSYVVDGLSSGTQYTVSLVNGGTDTIRTRKSDQSLILIVQTEITDQFNSIHCMSRARRAYTPVL